MNRPNPFLNIPSLKAFVFQAAEELKGGGRLLAVLGPYCAADFTQALARRLSALPPHAIDGTAGDALCQPGNKQLLICSGFETPEESANWFAGRIRGFHGKLLCAPLLLTHMELRLYLSLMLIGEEGVPSAYKDVVLGIAVEMGCGDVGLSARIVEHMVESYRARPDVFPDPIHCVTEYVREARGQNPSEIENLRKMVAQIVEGELDLTSGQMKHKLWLKAWQQGLASGLGSRMRLSWAVLLDGSGCPIDEAAYIQHTPHAGRRLFRDVALTRVCTAYQPILRLMEEFRELAVPTILEKAAELNEGLRFEASNNGVSSLNELGRDTDLLGLGYYAEQHRALVAECGLIGSIDMRRIRQLRNSILHLNDEMSPHAEGTISLETRRSLSLLLDVVSTQTSPFDPKLAATVL